MRKLLEYQEWSPSLNVALRGCKMKTPPSVAVTIKSTKRDVKKSQTLRASLVELKIV